MKLGICLCTLILAASAVGAARPDGLYAVIQTSKGKIVAKLEPELTPLTVTNFVGLAEGTITNAAFDSGRPFYDGSVFHRVVPGHVIQTGVPQSDRAKSPGYMFPNEIRAGLSHNRAGVLNMANSGPNTNSAQWCITLGDRSYLDGDFNVFGEVVEGLDVVMNIRQGDFVEGVRIERIGAKAEAFHPTTESFHALVQVAEARVAEHVEKKRAAEAEWLQRSYPTTPLKVRYRGTEARYAGLVMGWKGEPIEPIVFASGPTGLPGYFPEPQVFDYEPGKTKVGPNGIVDKAIAQMKPGERRVIVIPAAEGYGKSGFYPPEVPGQKRFVVSPNAMLVYEVEVLGK